MTVTVVEQAGNDVTVVDGATRTVTIVDEQGVVSTVTVSIPGRPGTDGTDGINGTDGTDGRSAYQVAVDSGFVGTETEWLGSLVGPPGDDGADGKSAYQLAVDSGFVGTEAEWLASLEGQDGTDGTDGKSAYQLALDNGFVGTEAEWLISLKGQDGADGKSAYQIAVDSGFVGTEAEWLASLEGPAGSPGVIQSIAAGTNITVDNTDPANPIISSTGGGTGGSIASSPLLASTSYNPQPAVIVPAATSSLVAIDPTNLSVTFTAPDSGKVLVKLNGYVVGAANTGLGWGLLDGATEIASKGVLYNYTVAVEGSYVVGWIISGLTPGSSYTYKWAQRRFIGTGNVSTQFGGSYQGTATMEVWDASANQSGGSGGGAISLDSLTDVDTSTTPPTDGQTMVYDAASGLWKPGGSELLVDESVIGNSYTVGSSGKTIINFLTLNNISYDFLLSMNATAVANSTANQGAFVTPSAIIAGDSAGIYGAEIGSTTDSLALAQTRWQWVKNPLANQPIQGDAMVFLKAGRSYTLIYKLEAGTAPGVSVVFTELRCTYRLTKL